MAAMTIRRDHMYGRMIRLHFDDDRFDDLVAWCEGVRSQIEAIDGFNTADLIRTGEGEGMILAFYDSDTAYEAASGDTNKALADMAQFLTAPIHIHAGTVHASFGRT